MKFIHITDPHIVPVPQTLCALDPRERLTTAIADINRHHRDAALTVMTGDLAYLGEPAAYRDLRTLLDALDMPYHLLVGNHDDRANFREAFPETPVDENGFVQYVVPTRAGHFVMMDTMEAEASFGIYCEKRFEWLEAQLTLLAGQPVFLFLHHPPFDIGINSLDASRLPDADRLANLIKKHGNVRYMFYGHVHRAVWGAWRGIPTSALPGTNHQVGLTLGDTDEMLGTHERPAYGVVLIEDDCVNVHLRDFIDESPRFPLLDKASKNAATAADLPSVPAEFVGI
ncbi:MAG: phosphodiesterase [Alphaproteobacteria bacterium]|nr:phosphodiesterase [Alphaproteobacteria bacterium]